MKNLEDRIYNKLLKESPQEESEEVISNFAKDSGLDFVRKGGNFIVKSPNEERSRTFDKLKNILSPLGFEHDITRGGSFGRLVLPAGKDDEGKRFNQTTVVVKPTSGGGASAAQAGKEYEEKLANYITDKYSDKGVMAITAGSGHGSDLEIIADGRDSMRLEVKTKMAADFGQFKIGFDVERGSWNPIRTIHFLENEKLYSDIFKSVVKQYVNSKAKFTKKILKHPSINLKNGVIRGLKPNEQTGITKRALEKRWFSGVTSVYLPFSFEKVSKYYASKGDRFIQIGTKGLFALKREDAKDMGVPYFGDVRLAANARIRIKPHAGTNGTHTFTVAIKLAGKIDNSPINLNNDSDLDMIIDKFLAASPIPIEESQGWSELHSDDWGDNLSRLTQMMMASDACCDTESISGLWSESDPQYDMSFLLPEPEYRDWEEGDSYEEDKEEWTEKEMEKRRIADKGISMEEIYKSREELGELSRQGLVQDGIATQSPDSSGAVVKVWRCGSTKEMDDSEQPVTSVTWSEKYAYRFCQGKKEYTHHKHDHTEVDAYYINLKDVLVSIPHVWDNAYDEKELLVRPQDLIPVEGYERKMEERIYERLVGEEKEINYKDHTSLTFDQLSDAVRTAQDAKEKADDKKMAKAVIPGEDYRKLKKISPHFEVVVPMSTKASCYYGAGTKWCTAANPKLSKNFFSEYYNEEGYTLYYILPKKVDPKLAVDPEHKMEPEEQEDFIGQFDDLFEGKKEDLKKKYPHFDLEPYKYGAFEGQLRGIDRMAQEDPSGKNKYLPWMVKWLDKKVEREEDGTMRNMVIGAWRSKIIRLVQRYHELLPYIGKKPGLNKKKKDDRKPREKTPYDKIAVVMNDSEEINAVFDAEDTEVDLDWITEALLPAWGVERDDADQLWENMIDEIHDDLKNNPNLSSEVADFWKAEADDAYFKHLSLNNDTQASFGSLTVNFTCYLTLLIPDIDANWQFDYNNDAFKGEDRSRREKYWHFVQERLDTDGLTERIKVLGLAPLKEFPGAAQWHNINQLYERMQPTKEGRAAMTFQQSCKYRFHRNWQDKFSGVFANDTKVQMNAIEAVFRSLKDVDASIGTAFNQISKAAPDHNFKETLRTEWLKQLEHITEEWMEANPRGNPEEEAAASDAAVDQLMKQLNLENKIYNKLTLNEVTFEDAEKNLAGKKIRKMIKAYNYQMDPEADPERGMGVALQRLKNTMRLFMPSDVADGDRGQAMLWAIRMLRTQDEFRGAVLHSALGDHDHHGNRTYPMSWNMLVQRTSRNLEKFFQHKRHMKVNDLNKIDSEEMLNDVVEKAKEAIEAENERKLDSDATEGTEFFEGSYRHDEDGEVARDPETRVPLFDTETGWVVAAAHNKGAACLLGKKTEWCTAAPGLDYFKDYYGGEDDPLFVVHTPEDERYQLAFGKGEFMDVDDSKMTPQTFEHVHDRIKSAIEAKGLEDRFEKIMNYERIDIAAKIAEAVEEVKSEQRFPREVDISADAEDDYDYTSIHGYCTAKFEFAMNGGHGDPLWSHRDEDEVVEELEEVFNEANGSFCVGNEDCEDPAENIEWNKTGDKGYQTFEISFSFFKSFYADIGDDAAAESETNDAIYWLDEVKRTIDSDYEGIKSKIRAALLELGVVKKNEIDELIDENDGEKIKGMLDNFEVYVLPQYNQANVHMRGDLPKEGWDLSRSGINVLERPTFGRKLWFWAIKAVEEVASRQLGLNFGIDEPDDEINTAHGMFDVPNGAKLHIDNGIVEVDSGKTNVNKEPIPMGLPRPRYWVMKVPIESDGTDGDVRTTNQFIQNLKIANRYPKLFRSAVDKLIKVEIGSLQKDEDNREGDDEERYFMPPIDPERLMPGELAEGLERLEEVSFDDALKSVSKQGKKMAKGHNYDSGKEPDHNLDKMMIAFGRKIRGFIPRDIEDGQKALATLWLLRAVKKDSGMRLDFFDDHYELGSWKYQNLRNNLERFFQHNRFMEPRDLNAVKDVDHLRDTVRGAKERIEADELKKMELDAEGGTDVLRNDEEWYVAVINNKGAACTLGKGTSWCTASPGLNYFKQYYEEDDPLFYIENKGTEEKWQFHYGTRQFMDINDHQVDRDKFEELHEILKDALEENDYEERYPKVFEHEHKDYDKEMNDLLESEREHIDNDQIEIHGNVDDDGEAQHFHAESSVEFVFDRPEGKWPSADVILGVEEYEQLAEKFAEETGGHLYVAGNNQDSDHGDSMEDYITVRETDTAIKVTVASWYSDYSMDFDGAEGSFQSMRDFFENVRYGADRNYNDIKEAFRGLFIGWEMLEGTKYDKILDSGEEVHDEFEEQYEPLQMTLDADDREIRINFSFPKGPEAVDVTGYQLGVGMQRFRAFIFRLGIKAAANKLSDESTPPVQLGLPGTDTDEDSTDAEKLQQLAWLLSASNSYLTALESAAENVYVRMDAKMGELLQWNDMFFEGMKAVARNYELVKKSLSRALEHVVIENPEDFPMMSKEKGPGGFRGADGGFIEEITTVTVGTASALRKAKSGYEAAKERFVDAEKRGDKKEADEMFQVMMNKKNLYKQLMKSPSEGLSEIITDEVMKAMTEIEPYQKKAQKWQKRALKLSIKGGNKYLTKGMKVASTKLGKSAPPGG